MNELTLFCAMSREVLNARDASPAIRRAMILLERVREDCADPEVDLLADAIRTINRAAEAGQPIGATAIDRLETLLVRCSSSSPVRSDASVQELVRYNALAETREILRKLGH